MSCVASPRDHHPVRRRRPHIPTTLYRAPAIPPTFDVTLSPPDLSPWLNGNTGIPGVMTHDSPNPGPHTVIVSLIHGNEYAGAAALARLLRDGLTPQRGRLTLIFANLDAFSHFDPENPTASRYLDEDMNRVWSPERLKSRNTSRELTRARELLPILDTADRILDLHSMLWDSEPLLIAPPAPHAIAFANALAQTPHKPDLVVTDLGHRAGHRLIEYRYFPQGAVLLEAGHHWSEDAVTRSRQVILHMLEGHAPGLPSRRAIVTDNVVAQTARFTFTRPYRGGEIIASGGTVLAEDGQDEICTPYDNCLLIMPNHCPGRGHMAVRLARLI